MHVASLVLDRKVGRAALVPCQRFDLPTGEKQGNPEAAVEAASSGEAKKRKKQKLPHLRKIPMNWLLQAIYSTMFCPTSHLFSIIWEAIPVQFFSSNTTVGYGSYDFITSTQRDTFLFSLTVFPPCYSCCCYVILSWLLVPDDIFPSPPYSVPILDAWGHSKQTLHRPPRARVCPIFLAAVYGMPRSSRWGSSRWRRRWTDASSKLVGRPGFQSIGGPCPKPTDSRAI